MNKNKKIAMAVIATVMAGAMVVPLAACNKDDPNNGKVDLEKWNVFDANGNLDYSAYNRDSQVTLNIAIGHEKDVHATAFASGSTYSLADGNTYQGGDMKPAWAQMGKDLQIKWNDCFAEAPKKTSDNLGALINGEGKLPYAQTDMFTTDLSKAVEKAAAGTNILNLADYLEYMPNFNNFLKENPVVYLSLLQDGMSTTNGKGKALYIAPYFDGNDDIERYCIIRQDMADKLLNGDTVLEGSTALGKSVAVDAFMPKTGALEIPVTVEDGTYKTVGKVYKNYDNAKTEVNKAGSNLNSAYLAASGKASANLASGNIIDIMNDAMTANPSVTGDKLVALFRAYVDACYTKTGEIGAESYYAADKRSNLFNGYDAAWDVDDLVAILRCAMTNQSSLLSKDVSGATRLYGIAPRTGKNDRTPDMVRLACQLYGARGADSRLEYTYIDAAGNLQDGRNDKAFYEALNKFSKLTEEGLVEDYSGIGKFDDDTGYKSTETFMMYDYCQTQTLNGFYGQGATGKNIPDDYNFAPILTPVSQWDVNANGKTDADEYFRFTESWRSTKTSGLALNGNLTSDKAKLKAALQFVDYLYSEDGQIVSTFGPMAENAAGKNGFWYGDVQTDPKTKKDENGKDVPENYFTYKGVKYQGYDYKGTVAPKITDTVYESFKGKAGVTGSTADLPKNVNGAKLNFTNYARFLIGSTLPVGVKSQAFEDQLTSACGKAGSAKVAAALSNKTESGYTVVRGMSLKMDENNWWYTCVPTGLPTPASYVSTLNASDMMDIKYLSGEAKKSGDKEFLSIFNSVILQGVKEGVDAEHPNQHFQQDITYNFSTVDALVEYMSSTKKAQTREDVYARGWQNAQKYWNYLKSAN
ncbi:MAG: hypothetical protein K2O28_01190 [Clostridia bacterium]|nr:hypothetical protein [Clostridia bacterium]